MSTSLSGTDRGLSLLSRALEDSLGEVAAERAAAGAPAAVKRARPKPTAAIVRVALAVGLVGAGLAAS